MKPSATNPNEPREREMSQVTRTFPQQDLDEVFAHPPLREVAFEIRFATRLRVAAELWKIQDEIVDQYPALSVEQVLQPSGTLLPINVFQNPNAGRAIKISQENFVVAFTRYSRFEDFKDEVIAQTIRFCEKFEIPSLLRVGLRYVNNILIPESGRTSEVLKYVRPFIDFDRLGADEIQQFVTEVRVRRSDHLITLRGALLGTPERDRKVYVLDVDCHSDRVSTQRDLPKLLEIYHESAQLSFLDHITEGYKQVMRGKS